jgi:hypothetical protein
MKHLLAVCFLLCFSGLASAQSWKFYRKEIRAGIGASNFLGELGGRNDIGSNGLRDLEFSLTRPTINVTYAYALNPWMKARADVLYGRLKGDDALTNEQFRENRNLHFRSPIVELSGLIEFYPFKDRVGHLYRMRGAKGKKISYLSPYFFTGVTLFYFNPKAKWDVDGKWHALQPLGTEGQGLPGGPAKYKRIGIAIPMGFGVSYAIDKHWSIGLEFQGRLTFTDYLDDVSGVYYDNNAIRTAKGDMAADLANPGLQDPALLSTVGYDPTNTGYQRGDSSDNDSYLFAIFTVRYRFLKGRIHLPKF